MSLFEAQADALRRGLSECRKEALALVSEGLAPAKANAGLILESEALCELGGPRQNSALALVYSNATAADGAWLIGRTLEQTAGEHADFALVAIVSGPELDAETFYQFTLRFPRLADHPGWMVRCDKTSVWVRVSRKAPADALSLAASTLVSRIRENFEKIEAVELFFVVGEPELVGRLQPIAEASQKLMREIKTGVWKGRGFDYESCELSGHCGACSDKKTCASVRNIQARVKLVRKNQTTPEKEQPCRK